MPCLIVQNSSAGCHARAVCARFAATGVMPSANDSGATPGAPWHCTQCCRNCAAPRAICSALSSGGTAIRFARTTTARRMPIVEQPVGRREMLLGRGDVVGAGPEQRRRRCDTTQLPGQRAWSSLQPVQIGGHVASVLLGHLRSGIAVRGSIDLRRADPAHHVVGGVRQQSCEIRRAARSRPAAAHIAVRPLRRRECGDSCRSRTGAAADARSRHRRVRPAKASRCTRSRARTLQHDEPYDWNRSHRSNAQSPASSRTNAAGTHMISPPSCWSCNVYPS